jgi:NTP pyrophosphatase (non-canonical NTP hydrolase)
MNFNDYQAFCVSLANQNGLDMKTAIAVRTAKLFGEACELTRMIWDFYQAKAYDRAKFIEEMGDVAWYLGVLAHHFGLTLEAVAGVMGPVVTPNAYQRQVYMAVVPSPYPVEEVRKATTARLLFEIGEVAEFIGKHIEQGHPLDLDAVRIALGKALATLSALGFLMNVLLEEAIGANVDKLRTRYPGGRFTTEASVARVDTHAPAQSSGGVDGNYYRCDFCGWEGYHSAEIEGHIENAPECQEVKA